MEKQKVYTTEEVKASCTAYFSGDDLAISTWMDKYAMKNDEGEFLELSPDDMHRRLAKEFARIEKKYTSENKHRTQLSEYGRNRKKLDEEAIYKLFQRFRYVIPQGSVMTSLGNPHTIASLSNCVVLPEIYDSYGGILHTDQQLAQLFKRRCGVGIDISSLRPEGLTVKNAAQNTSGAVSFMERFSNTTREVAQNGRRGALMITMDIAHPDIEKFIEMKQDLSKVTGANVSVRVSDKFMKALELKQAFTLKWPIEGAPVRYTKEIKAQDLWNKIIKCAHATAEPGIIFWDSQHHYSTSSMYPGFKNLSTNPCSEIAMQGGDSCRLMALNLYRFVEKPFTKEARFQEELFYEITYEAQRLMDDLVDLELEAVQRILEKIKHDPEPDFIKQVERKTWELLYETGKKGRRTGLGFTALADTLAALGLAFDSEEALSTVEGIMKVKCKAEFNSSIDMAIERGCFTGFNKEIEKTSLFIQKLKNTFPDVYTRMEQYGRRNISISTVAPTGSISILTQTSSGIEPVFALSYRRRKKMTISETYRAGDMVDAMGDHWQEYTVLHQPLQEWKEITGYTDEKKSPYFANTAAEINWERRLTLQAIVQQYTTHSISSTLNLSKDTSREVVAEIYYKAWKKGLKGVTVYREGSRSGVLLQMNTGNSELADYHSPSRPAELEATIMRFKNQQEDWIAFVGLLNKRPYEIFTGRAEESFSIPDWVSKGWITRIKTTEQSRYDFYYSDKQNSKVCVEGLSRIFNQEYWNYAKLISGVLRQGMPLVQVADLIENLNLFPDTINTWKRGVERALKQFIPDGTAATDKVCPKCQDPEGLIYQEGCLVCKSCGHTECG